MADSAGAGPRVAFIVVTKGLDCPSAEERRPSGARYTRDAIRGMLQFMGCKPRHAYKATQLVFQKLERFAAEGSKFSSGSRQLWGVGAHEEGAVYVTLPRSEFYELVCSTLTEYNYKYAPSSDEIKAACSLKERRRHIIVLLCGTSGSGKSTLASILASRLGISTVLSTDSVRHMLRGFTTKEASPLLFASTYEAGEALLKQQAADARIRSAAAKGGMVKGNGMGGADGDGDGQSKQPVAGRRGSGTKEETAAEGKEAGEALSKLQATATQGAAAREALQGKEAEGSAALGQKGNVATTELGPAQPLRGGEGAGGDVHQSGAPVEAAAGAGGEGLGGAAEGRAGVEWTGSGSHGDPAHGAMLVHRALEAPSDSGGSQPSRWFADGQGAAQAGAEVPATVTCNPASADEAEGAASRAWPSGSTHPSEPRDAPATASTASTAASATAVPTATPVPTATSAGVPHELVIRGYKAQCELVAEQLESLVAGFEARRQSLVVEGVHLHLGLVMRLAARHPGVMPFLVYIKSEGKHVERMAVRAKYMTLDPNKNKYVKNMRHIRWIQDYLLRKAEKHMVPCVENTNIDRSVGLIHLTVLGCLKRMLKGEAVLDAGSSSMRMLHGEYSSVLESLAAAAAAGGPPAAAGAMPAHRESSGSWPLAPAPAPRAVGSPRVSQTAFAAAAAAAAAADAAGSGHGGSAAVSMGRPIPAAELAHAVVHGRAAAQGDCLPASWQAGPGTAGACGMAVPAVACSGVCGAAAAGEGGGVRLGASPRLGQGRCSLDGVAPPFARWSQPLPGVAPAAYRRAPPTGAYTGSSDSSSPAIATSGQFAASQPPLPPAPQPTGPAGVLDLRSQAAVGQVDRPWLAAGPLPHPASGPASGRGGLPDGADAGTAALHVLERALGMLGSPSPPLASPRRRQRASGPGDAASGAALLPAVSSPPGAAAHGLSTAAGAERESGLVVGPEPVQPQGQAHAQALLSGLLLLARQESSPLREHQHSHTGVQPEPAAAPIPIPSPRRRSSQRANALGAAFALKGSFPGVAPVPLSAALPAASGSAGQAGDPASFFLGEGSLEARYAVGPAESAMLPPRSGSVIGGGPQLSPPPSAQESTHGSAAALPSTAASQAQDTPGSGGCPQDPMPTPCGPVYGRGDRQSAACAFSQTGCTLPLAEQQAQQEQQPAVAQQSSSRSYGDRHPQTAPHGRSRGAGLLCMSETDTDGASSDATGASAHASALAAATRHARAGAAHMQQRSDLAAAGGAPASGVLLDAPTAAAAVAAAAGALQRFGDRCSDQLLAAALASAILDEQMEGVTEGATAQQQQQRQRQCPPQPHQLYQSHRRSAGGESQPVGGGHKGGRKEGNNCGGTDSLAPPGATGRPAAPAVARVHVTDEASAAARCGGCDMPGAPMPPAGAVAVGAEDALGPSPAAEAVKGAGANGWAAAASAAVTSGPPIAGHHALLPHASTSTDLREGTSSPSRTGYSSDEDMGNGAAAREAGEGGALAGGRRRRGGGGGRPMGRGALGVDGDSDDADAGGPGDEYGYAYGGMSPLQEYGSVYESATHDDMDEHGDDEDAAPLGRSNTLMRHLVGALERSRMRASASAAAAAAAAAVAVSGPSLAMALQASGHGSGLHGRRTAGPPPAASASFRARGAGRAWPTHGSVAVPESRAAPPPGLATSAGIACSPKAQALEGRDDAGEDRVGGKHLGSSHGEGGADARVDWQRRAASGAPGASGPGATPIAQLRRMLWGGGLETQPEEEAPSNAAASQEGHAGSLTPSAPGLEACATGQPEGAGGGGVEGLPPAGMGVQAPHGGANSEGGCRTSQGPSEPAPVASTALRLSTPFASCSPPQYGDGS